MTKSNSKNDLELLSQIKLGRTQLFEDLVRKYQNKIIAFCHHMLSDKGLAEDAAQEVFVKTWLSLKDFRPDSSFSAWLFRIARNHCIDVIRSSRKSAHQVSLNEFDEGTASSSHERSVAQDSGMNRSEAKDMLRFVLQHLNPSAREVLLLREMYGFPYEEISQVLECSLDAVKSRLKRARIDVTEHLRHFSDPVDVSINRSMK